MFNDLLTKYAKLAVIKGVNMQKDGLLIINSPIECNDFARLIAEEAYISGASDVVINYTDEKFNKIRFNNCDKKTLSFIPDFERDKYDYYVEKNASFLTISASDPDIYKDVDSSKISVYQKSRRAALKKYHDATISNKNSWCIISIPTESWAKKIFSELQSEKAVEKLWDAIFTVMRLKEDNPIDAWNEHTNLLHKKVVELNSHEFEYLHFTNSLGTDLKVGLVKNHIWCGGEDTTQAGLKFIANMPTEEVYTTPKFNDVNGIVFSSKPLSYAGNLINNFSLNFKDGKVIDFTAETGGDVLEELLNTDEGSRHLGEVALVPYNSPISNSNIVFFNTLYDENASCHLALGASYPCCIKDGEKLSNEESKSAGANISLTHVDFMIGSKDTNIVGIKANGEKVQIFKNGNWA